LEAKNTPCALSSRSRLPLPLQVMDSPFARLTELMVELVDEQKLPIPKPFMKVALGMMRRSVRKRAGFNIDDVAPLNHVEQCFIPALFGESPSQGCLVGRWWW